MPRRKKTSSREPRSLLPRSEPRASAMRCWIEPVDIRDALTAAKALKLPDEDELCDAAYEATLAAQRIIGHLRSPRLPDLDAVAAALGQIESGCATALQTILDRMVLPASISENDVAAVLTERLGRTTDATLAALRDAVAASMADDGQTGCSVPRGEAPSVVGTSPPRMEGDPSHPPAKALTDILLAVDRLRACAGAARAQFEIGRQREAKTKDISDEQRVSAIHSYFEASMAKDGKATCSVPGGEAPFAVVTSPPRTEVDPDHSSGTALNGRTPPCSLAFLLIRYYQAWTGGRLSFSRQQVGPKGALQPAGPLVRYLQLLFERARTKLAEDAAHEDLARARDWTPSAETLAAWIKDFRASCAPPRRKSAPSPP